jgi:hypothetical protein
LKFADWLQTISLGAVVVALLLNYRQARGTAKQAAEASKQVALSMSMMRQDAYRDVTNYGANFNTILFQSGEDLLSWFLSSRGIRAGSHEDNLRFMFMFVRMDVHESVFLSYQGSLLEPDAWNAWKQVVEADVSTPEFRSVWRVVANHYIASFQEFVGSVIREQDAAATVQARLAAPQDAVHD